MLWRKVKQRYMPCWRAWKREQALNRVVSQGHAEERVFVPGPEGGEGLAVQLVSDS